MLDFEAAVSGLSCAAWMYRHTLLHPIQMGEKMVCQAGSDRCDPCGDRRVCGVSGGHDTGRLVGFFFLAESNGREDGVDSCVPKGEQNRGRNELFLSDREMPDLVQYVDIRYDHNGIGDEELCAELYGKRKAWW